MTTLPFSSFYPFSIAISSFNEMVYITEVGTNSIRIMNRTSLTSSPSGIFIPSLRGICLSYTSADWGLVTSLNGRIYKIDFQTNAFETFVGQAPSGMANGYGTNAQFNNPYVTALSSDDSYALVADMGNHLIRKITMTTALVETFAGTSGSSGSINGVGTNAKFYGPVSVVISPDGTFALVVNFNSHILNKILIATAEVSVIAGNGAGYSNGFGTNAKFNSPYGFAISSSGDFVVVADYANKRVRLVNLTSFEVTNFAGSGTTGNTSGTAINAQFNSPIGVAVSPQLYDPYVLVADYSNFLIRKIFPTPLPPLNYDSVGDDSGLDQPKPFSFGVKVGGEGIGKAILVRYLKDMRKGENSIQVFPCSH